MCEWFFLFFQNVTVVADEFVIQMGELNSKSLSTVALPPRTFNSILRLCDRSSFDCGCSAVAAATTPHDSQCVGGRGKAFGGGASKHLEPANNEEFGGDDDADDAALKPPGLDR